MKLVAESINEFRTESLNEEKWIQKTNMNAGALHKDLGIPEDKTIPMSLINKKIKELNNKKEKDGKLSKTDSTFLKRLNLAKTLKTKV